MIGFTIKDNLQTTLVRGYIGVRLIFIARPNSLECLPPGED